MKKDFSFYEFVGILVPGVTLLFFSEIVIELTYKQVIVDFSKVGESFIFLIIAYGVGQILHAVGNLFEYGFWVIYGGMPTVWLNKKNRFGNELFEKDQKEKITQKIVHQFGEVPLKDYRKYVYNWLCLKENITEKRIDVFNANYSQFRGLTVTFYILSLIVLFFLGWKLALVSFTIGLLSNYRMIRFAKLYALELFLTYLNLE